MRERELRKRCRRLLQDLDVRPPLDVEELCRRLAACRGRPIKLVPYPIEVPGPFGLWFMTDTADFIFYQQQTTRPHQHHIILHEIGHMIADHPSDEADTDALVAIMGHTPRGEVSRSLRRTCYDSDYEREAELIATIILEWASVLDAVPGETRTGDGPALDRLGTSLSNRRGWV
ncbi:MAG: hypothetical protein JOZ47_08270 [Kutzneria sp.]|nr:hypothetical protein [Kutzneria sp.]